MELKRWRTWLMLAAAGLSTAVAADPPDALLFARFQEKIQQDLAVVINYTCLETIKRSMRLPKQAFKPLDTVRLEVSRVNGKELFTWPGARQFSDASLASFASGGFTSTGMFESAAHEIFMSGGADFKYHGEERVDGRSAVRYDFQLPPAHGYQVKMGEVSAAVAMQGSFWFDPVSLDLIRIDSHGIDIPKQLKLSQLNAAIGYARVSVAGAPALLPKRAEVELAGLSGVTNRNDIEFSQCHAYQSESVINFEPPVETASGAPQPRLEMHLPPGLLVHVILETDIDFKTSAIGDPVAARVREDVKRGGELIVPAGARIHGRIRRLDRRQFGERYFIIGIELIDIDWENAHADFYGELVETDARKGIEPGFAVRGGVTCVVRGKKLRIEPGFGWLWRVLARPAGEPPER